MIIVIHKKTGNKYYIIQENIINATNSRDGETVVLYKNKQGMKFVRETNEFWNKFIKYNTTPCISKELGG